MAVMGSVILLTVVFSAVHSKTTFNAALGKAASQSSVYLHFSNALAADKAVDGNTDPNVDNCASTNVADWNPWWKVDLGGNYIVTSVVITNRVILGERLHDFTVTVSSDDNISTVCGQYPGTVPSAATVTVTCDQVTWGHLVKITKAVTTIYDTLTLCEVQVIAVDRSYMVFERAIGKTTTSDLSVTMTADLPTCANACKTANDCVGINYNDVVSLCQLLNNTDSEDTSVNNGWDFYVVMP